MSKFFGSRGLFYVVGAVIIALAIAILFVVFRGDDIIEEKVIRAPEKIKESMVVKKIEVPVIYNAIGTIASRDQVEVSARITARIIDFNINSGDAVKKGEVIAKLDDTDLEAAVKHAQAVFDEAKKNYDRSKSLFEKDVVSAASLDGAQRAFDTASAELVRAKAVLSYATIVAPVDGVVYEKLANQGDMAVVGKPIIKLFDPKRMMLEACVPENLAIKMRDLMKKDNEHQVIVKIDAIDAEVLGELVEIVPYVDPSTRTFIAKVCLGDDPVYVKDGKNHPLNAFPGMFGRLIFTIGQREAIIIPSKYVIWTGQLEYVWLSSDNNSIREEFITTVPYDGSDGELEVLTGLKSGDRIIVR